MNMELFFVAEITEEKLDNNETVKVAKFISGPFGSWDSACDAKHIAQEKNWLYPNLEIVTQLIDVSIS